MGNATSPHVGGRQLEALSRENASINKAGMRQNAVKSTFAYFTVKFLERMLPEAALSGRRDIVPVSCWRIGEELGVK